MGGSKRIYFDGGLPQGKWGVRVARLEAYLRQLVTYQANNRELKSGNYSGTESSVPVESLFDFFRPVRPKFRVLPATPFLVPAALESLASSQFAEIVEVIPGEADAFCAAAARESGGLVVTGDSDLLVYDLGLNGGVAFLEQFEHRVCEGSPGSHYLLANLAIPREITQRLDVESMQRLAFELKGDPSIALQEAVQRSKREIGLTGKRPYYQVFCEEYAKEMAMSHDGQVGSLVTSSQLLDPRLSELALQFGDPQQNIVHMYLPFLIEDPSRVSAWGVSRGLRALAYTILAGLGTQRRTPSILEYSRRDIRIVANDVRVLDSSETLHSAKTLIRKLVAVKDRFAALAPTIGWRIFGMIEVFSRYVEGGRPLPSHHDFSKIFPGNQGRLSSWQDVQLAAMMQAALYSMRLLKQALDCVNRTQKGTGRQELEVLELHSHLESLPSLQELIPTWQGPEDIDMLGFELNTILAFVKNWAQTVQDDDQEEESADNVSTPAYQPGTPERVESETPWVAVKSRHTKLKRKDTIIKNVETTVKTHAKRVQNIYGMLADTSYNP